MAQGAPQQNPPNPIPPEQGGGGSAAPETTTAPTQTPSTPDYAQYIPEQYRSDPKRYFDEIEEHKQWAEYGRRIAPHHKTFEQVQKEWEQFNSWRKSQSSGPQPQTREPTRTPEPEADIDWSDPDEVAKAYRRQQQAIAEHVETFKQEMSTLRQEQETGQKTLMELLRIQQQLRDIRDQELYGHIKFSPKTNPRDLAQYMVEHGINDAEKARDLLYGRHDWESEKQGLIAEAQKRYEQGMADKEAELAAQRVTTETSPGTPWRMRTEGRSKTPPTSRDRRQEIMDKMAQRIGAPREYAE